MVFNSRAVPVFMLQMTNSNIFSVRAKFPCTRLDKTYFGIYQNLEKLYSEKFLRQFAMYTYVTLIYENMLTRLYSPVNLCIKMTI